ncbi:MAG: ADP-ribose pyrophosphatase [Dehalococcoidia bacterium]|nr:MAG: ADP-ribose pyrophosphatase [Dehalococcoidia bacterium]
MSARFCPHCGSALHERVPPGDSRPRLVCTGCGHVHYLNPKVVVGAVAVNDGRVVLIKRGIEPQKGKWGLPAGYLELGETLEAGAARETLEETGLEIAISRLLNLYTRVEAGVINVLYLADVIGGNPTPASHETLEVGQFLPDEIPWDELAFPSHRWALEEWLGNR